MGAHENLGVLSDAQAIAADDTASTNTIDLRQTSPKIGVGQHSPYLCIRTAVAPTAVSNDTLSIELQSDADDGSGDPAGTWTHVVFMPLVGVNGAEVNQSDARLATAGAWINRIQLPYDLKNPHIRLMYRNTTSVGVFTIDAWLEDVPASDFRGGQVLFSNVGNP
jgi:hypothetical protein